MAALQNGIKIFRSVPKSKLLNQYSVSILSTPNIKSISNHEPTSPITTSSSSSSYSKHRSYSGRFKGSSTVRTGDNTSSYVRYKLNKIFSAVNKYEFTSTTRHHANSHKSRQSKSRTSSSRIVTSELKLWTSSVQIIFHVVRSIIRRIEDLLTRNLVDEEKNGSILNRRIDEIRLSNMKKHYRTAAHKTLNGNSKTRKGNENIKVKYPISKRKAEALENTLSLSYLYTTKSKSFSNSNIRNAPNRKNNLVQTNYKKERKFNDSSKYIRESFHKRTRNSAQPMIRQSNEIIENNDSLLNDQYFTRMVRDKIKRQHGTAECKRNNSNAEENSRPELDNEISTNSTLLSVDSQPQSLMWRQNDCIDKSAVAQQNSDIHKPKDITHRYKTNLDILENYISEINISDDVQFQNVDKRNKNPDERNKINGLLLLEMFTKENLMKNKDEQRKIRMNKKNEDEKENERIKNTEETFKDRSFRGDKNNLHELGYTERIDNKVRQIFKRNDLSKTIESDETSKDTSSPTSVYEIYSQKRRKRAFKNPNSDDESNKEIHESGTAKTAKPKTQNNTSDTVRESVQGSLSDSTVYTDRLKREAQSRICKVHRIYKTNGIDTGSDVRPSSQPTPSNEKDQRKNTLNEILIDFSKERNISYLQKLMDETNVMRQYNTTCINTLKNEIETSKKKTDSGDGMKTKTNKGKKIKPNDELTKHIKIKPYDETFTSNTKEKFAKRNENEIYTSSTPDAKPFERIKTTSRIGQSPTVHNTSYNNYQKNLGASISEHFMPIKDAKKINMYDRLTNICNSFSDKMKTNVKETNHSLSTSSKVLQKSLSLIFQPKHTQEELNNLLKLAKGVPCVNKDTPTKNEIYLDEENKSEIKFVKLLKHPNIQKHVLENMRKCSTEGLQKLFDSKRYSQLPKIEKLNRKYDEDRSNQDEHQAVPKKRNQHKPPVEHKGQFSQKKVKNCLNLNTNWSKSKNRNDGKVRIGALSNKTSKKSLNVDKSKSKTDLIKDIKHTIRSSMTDNTNKTSNLNKACVDPLHISKPKQRSSSDSYGIKGEILINDLNNQSKINARHNQGSSHITNEFKPKEEIKMMVRFKNNKFNNDEVSCKCSDEIFGESEAQSVMKSEQIRDCYIKTIISGKLRKQIETERKQSKSVQKPSNKCPPENSKSFQNNSSYGINKLFPMRGFYVKRRQIELSQQGKDHYELNDRIRKWINKLEPRAEITPKTEGITNKSTTQKLNFPKDNEKCRFHHNKRYLKPKGLVNNSRHLTSFSSDTNITVPTRSLASESKSFAVNSINRAHSVSTISYPQIKNEHINTYVKNDKSNHLLDILQKEYKQPHKSQLFDYIKEIYNNNQLLKNDLNTNYENHLNQYGVNSKEKTDVNSAIKMQKNYTINRIKDILNRKTSSQPNDLIKRKKLNMEGKSYLENLSSMEAGDAKKQYFDRVKNSQTLNKYSNENQNAFYVSMQRKDEQNLDTTLTPQNTSHRIQIRKSDITDSFPMLAASNYCRRLNRLRNLNSNN